METPKKSAKLRGSKKDSKPIKTKSNGNNKTTNIATKEKVIKPVTTKDKAKKPSPSNNVKKNATNKMKKIPTNLDGIQATRKTQDGEIFSILGNILQQRTIEKGTLQFSFVKSQAFNKKITWRDKNLRNEIKTNETNFNEVKKVTANVQASKEIVIPNLYPMRKSSSDVKDWLEPKQKLSKNTLLEETRQDFHS